MGVGEERRLREFLPKKELGKSLLRIGLKSALAPISSHFGFLKVFLANYSDQRSLGQTCPAMKLEFSSFCLPGEAHHRCTSRNWWEERQGREYAFPGCLAQYFAVFESILNIAGVGTFVEPECCCVNFIWVAEEEFTIGFSH